MTNRHPLRCQFVPPWLLEHLVEAAGGPTATVDPISQAVQQTLTTDAQIRADRQASAGRTPPRAAKPAWAVYTAASKQTLPGKVMRTAGDPDSADPAVNEAATGGQAALELFRQVSARNSYDNP